MRILARDGNPGAWSWWENRLGPVSPTHFLSGRLSRTHPLNPISCDQVDDDTHRDFGIVFGMVGLNSSSTIPKSGVVEHRTWSNPHPQLGVVSGSAEPDLVGVMWWASSRTSISLTHGSIDLAIPCNFLAVIAAVRRRDPERQPREGRLRAGSTVACTTPSRPL